MASIVPDMDWSPLANLGKTYSEAQQRQQLQEGLAKMGLPGNMNLAQLALQQQAVQRGEARDTRDFGFRTQEATRAQSNADRTAALQREQFTAGIEGAKMPAGFERDPNNPGGQRPIKGGAADPDYIQRANEARDKGRPLSVTDISKLSEEGGKFQTVKGALGSFEDGFAGHVLVGDARNQVARNLPSWATDPDARRGAAWWQEYDRYKNVIRNDLFGSALTVSEQKAFTAADITPNMNPELVRKNLQIQQDVLEGAMKRKAGALVEQGYKPEVIAKSYGLKLEELGVTPKPKAGAQPGGSAPVSTAPAAATPPAPAFNPQQAAAAAKANPQAAIAEARTAIQNGANPAAVAQRLQQMGINPSVLGGGAPAGPGSAGAIY